jgi:hypothetical protein
VAPPPPPPKIPLSGPVVQHNPLQQQSEAIIYSPIVYAPENETASSKPQSPAVLPLPESKTSNAAPSESQNLLQQAITNSTSIAQPDVALNDSKDQVAVAVQSKENIPLSKDSKSEPKSDMLVKDESLKTGVEDTDSKRESKATASEEPSSSVAALTDLAVAGASEANATASSLFTKGPSSVEGEQVKTKRKSDEAKPDHTNLVELPARNPGEDDEPVMKAVSYPGDEWIPRWDPE